MKKNLLLFTSTFPRWPADEDIPQFVFELGKELTKFFNVHVLAPHAPKAEKREDIDGMKVIRFPYFYPENLQRLAYGTGILSNIRKSKLGLLQIPGFFACQFWALHTVVRHYNIDVVNSHWMIPQGLTAALLKPRLGFKHIHTIHAAGLFALRRLPLGKQMARLICERSDAIFCVSTYNRQILEQLTQRKIEADILPMGIYTRFYREESDKDNLRRELRLGSGKVILYVGKLSEKKGVTFLLSAFKSVLDEWPEATLVIVGTGDLEVSLKSEAQQLGIADRIWFAGWQGKASVKKYFAACDAVAVPSIIDSRGETEGLPVVLLEALASGKPVVATRVAGAIDVIVDGENGFLAEPQNPNDLGEKINRLLSMNTQTLSKTAQDSVQKYDWENIGHAYKQKILSLF